MVAQVMLITQRRVFHDKPVSSTRVWCFLMPYLPIMDLPQLISRHITRLRIFVTCWLVILACLMAGVSQAQPYPHPSAKFRHLTNVDGLSQLQVNAFAQDNDGFIWIATNDGLNRFDGYDFHVYRPDLNNPDSLVSHVIFDLLVDSQDTLWVATAKGLNRYDRNNDNFVPVGLKDEHDGRIISLFEDSQGSLWVGSKNNGLSRLDKQTGQLIKYLEVNVNPDNASSHQINSITEDQKGFVWVGTDKGLYFVEPQSKVLRPYPFIGDNRLSDNRILALAVNNDQLWIGTQIGLNRLELATGHVSSYFHQADSQSIADNQIQSILVDSSGALWIASYNGVSKLTTKERQFVTFRQDISNVHSINGRVFTSIFEDAAGVLWIGSYADGISLLNSKDLQFGHYNTQSLPADCLSSDAIYAALFDSRGQLWLGAYGEGLHKIQWPRLHCEVLSAKGNSNEQGKLSSNLITALHEDSQNNIWVGMGSTGVDKISPDGEIENLRHDPSNANSLSKGSVFAIVEDAEHNLWFATAGGGLSRYSLQHKHFTHYRHDDNNPQSLASDSINALLVDNEGMVWVGTDDGGLDRLNPLTGHFRHYLNNDNRHNGSASQIFSIHQDRQGILWIGGGNSGLVKYDLVNDRFTYFTVKDGLPSNTIYKIVQDAQQHLWLSTNSGLSRFDFNTQSFTNFTVADGLQDQEFTLSGLYHRQTDQLFAMGVNGFNAFQPAKISLDLQAPKIAITGFRLFNEVVDIASIAADKGVSQNITQLNHIQLQYDDSMFSLLFSALHFADPARNRYAYKMVGFDDNWRYTDAKQRVATYTNISPGQYTFVVKGSNRDGVWNEQGRSITITIMPPLWLTWWAKLIYLIVLIVTPVAFYRARTKSLRNRTQKLELTVRERTGELTREKSIVEALLAQKSDEMANVSHEFRTPLTLIMSSAKAMAQLNLPASGEQKLQIINNNSLRLSRMVDQLLMLEKFKVQNIARTKAQSVKAITSKIVHSFMPLAQEKEIVLRLEQLEDIWLQASSDMVESILINLLSNALKYTPSGGYVGINIRQTRDNFCHLVVRDTGCGIDSKLQKTIFERFERVFDEHNHEVAGAGIGLALVKELVRAHGGSITLTSEPGKGACFEVILSGVIEPPITNVVASTNSEILEQEREHLALQLSETDLSVYDDVLPPSDGRSVVLVIEDNQAMCQYIIETLQSEYHCIGAADGEAGLKLAEKTVPDLIISDIMMPKMDGYEVVQKLRRHLLTSHIPIILLTARGDRDSRLKGWAEQADDYLTKPFDEQELLLRVANLLAIRSIIQQRLSQQLLTPKAEKTVTDEAEVQSPKSSPVRDFTEQAFIDKLNNIVETLYQDEQLRIGIIAQQMAMSERAFSRKLKGVMNISPSDYLRTYRLQKSVELLKQGCQVKQIAFSVGFTSHAYFCHCFKAYYQVPPSQYLDQNEGAEV